MRLKPHMNMQNNLEREGPNLPKVKWHNFFGATKFSWGDFACICMVDIINLQYIIQQISEVQRNKVKLRVQPNVTFDHVTFKSTMRRRAWEDMLASEETSEPRLYLLEYYIWYTILGHTSIIKTHIRKLMGYWLNAVESAIRGLKVIFFPMLTPCATEGSPISTHQLISFTS